MYVHGDYTIKMAAQGEVDKQWGEEQNEEKNENK
jgi:hypothetical protein